MKTDPTFWLLARASGLTAYVLLTGSVLAGLVVKSRPFGRAVKTASATDVHRFLALLGLGMLVLHGVALTLDKTVHMSLAALVVPGLSHVPARLGRLRRARRGARRPDRRVVLAAPAHRRSRTGAGFTGLTYLVFLMGTVHGLKAGTDSSQPWAFALYVSAVGAVTFATAWRVLTRPSRPVTARTGGTHVQDRDRAVAL